MTDRDLEQLALGNVLNQLGHVCANAIEIGTQPAWQTIFELGRQRTNTLVGVLVDEIVTREVRARVIEGPLNTDIPDLREKVALALLRGRAGAVELLEGALSALAGIAEDVSPEALTTELRAEILDTVRFVRRRMDENLMSLRPSACVDLIEYAKRSTPDVFSTRAATSKKLFDVWFGTNRRPVHKDGKLTGFSADRDYETHLGRCAVSIPKAHRIGSVGSPWWHRIVHGDDRLAVDEKVEYFADVFWDELRDRLAAAEPGPADAVIFIHGYNVSFEEAAIRAAQLGADLALPGLMAFFSWPSRGRLFSYLADEATIEASEQPIAKFLTDFCNRSGARAIHIICHSMGNRGLLRAVSRIADQVQRHTGRLFGQIILAAPDVDVDVFGNHAKAFTLVSDRTTLYVSPGDRAVLSSRLLHSANRVGFAPPVYTFDGVDTVNVTDVDLIQLGHGYVGSSREVLTDIFNLLTSGAPPERRPMLRRVSPNEGGRYWEFAL